MAVQLCVTAPLPHHHLQIPCDQSFTSHQRATCSRGRQHRCMSYKVHATQQTLLNDQSKRGLSCTVNSKALTSFPSSASLALAASSALRKFTTAYMRPGKVTTSSTAPYCSKTTFSMPRASRVCRLPSQRCLLGGVD